MVPKKNEKIRAVELRKQGLSYSEILKAVNVSKSTLSLWLRNTTLDENTRFILKEKLVSAQKLGAEAKRRQRIEKVLQIERLSMSEIPALSKDDVFLMGIMLYWAEGTKIRKGSISQRVEFSNSDPNMCRFFMKWLKVCLDIPDNDIVPCIYIHESKNSMQEKVLLHWSQQINFPKDKFGRTCLTKTVYPRKNKRRNRPKYYGQLRIRVKRSTDLNRKIAGWTKGICFKSGVNLQNFV